MMLMVLDLYGMAVALDAEAPMISGTHGGYHPEMESIRPQINRLLIALGVLLVVLCVLIFWPQTWFDPESGDGTARARLGEQVEFRLVEELQKIRPNGDSWQLRITDEAINAWLATRLRPWMNHQDAAWPEDVSVPQIHFARSGIDVGIAIEGVAGGFPLILGFRPTLDEGRFRLKPGWVRIGQLPIPFARSGLDSHIENLIPRMEGSVSNLISALLDDAALEAVIPLVDGRSVEISGFRLDSGSMLLQASTQPASR